MAATNKIFLKTIPPPRRVAAIVLAAGVGIGFFGGGYFFLGRTNDTLTLIFISVITLGGILLAAAGVLFECFAPETVELHGAYLTVTRSLFGIKMSEKFDVTLMQHLRVGAADYWNNGTYVFSNGRIQFEYKSQQKAFGVSISDEEAFQILDVIRAQISPEQIKPQQR